MEVKKITTGIKKYKYAVLVLLLGIALLLWPGGGEKKEQKTQETAQSASQVQTEDQWLKQMERELSETLSQIAGAGEVKVVLSLKTGRQSIYQSDVEETTQDAESGQSRSSSRKTVILSDGQSEQAAVAQTVYPCFQGAVVISHGADQPAVKLDLVNAVSSLTGLGTDKITVIKMKQ